MNSIIPIHFDVPAPGALPLDAALDRLGAWLDAEIAPLEELLDVTGHEDAVHDINALNALHLEATSNPADLRRLLEDAQASLERLHECLQSIPFDGPLRGRVPSDFDAWLRWTGARLQDIQATLRYALGA